MRRVLALSVMALALTALTAGALYAADTNKGAGTVTGKVVDKEGKAVSGVTVTAMLPPVKGEKKDAPADKEARKEAIKEHMLAQATTAADGTFTLASVPEGKVLIVARKPGTGMARTTADVKAGETVSLSAPLTLAKPAEGEHKGPGAGEHKKEKK